MIDKEKLRERLPQLTGDIFIACENAISNTGTIMMDARYNSEFQVRIAAAALEIPYQEITALPMNEFKAVCQIVFNFFFVPSAKAPAAT